MADEPSTSAAMSLRPLSALRELAVKGSNIGPGIVLVRFVDRLSREPATLLFSLCAAQLLLWTLAPTLASDAPPFDVVENTAWGPEWLISSYKNPALSSWLLELSRLFTGAYGWPAYLLSQIFICLTFVLVFLLGREPLGTERALAGTLLLTGVYYFSWPTPEFNQDIAQMPLWAGVALALWRATETNRLGWWVILGLFAAAGLYAKLSTAVLLITAAGWILFDRQARRRIATRGPWIGLAVFLVALSPLAVWLVRNGFAPASYAVDRGKSHSFSAPGFLLTQAEAVLPMLLVLGFSGLLLGNQHSASGCAGRSETQRHFGGYLIVLTAAPILICIIMTAATGTGARRMWGVPMLNLAGLLAIWLTSERFTPTALRRIAYAAAALIIIVPIVYAAGTAYSPMLTGNVKRQNWPQAEIATRMRELWAQSTGRPLRIVAGDRTNWLAGLIVLACCDGQPSLFTNADVALSPWITDERLAREGALVVWQEHGAGPSPELGRLIGSRARGLQRFNIRGFPNAAPIDVRYAIIPPKGVQ